MTENIFIQKSLSALTKIAKLNFIIICLTFLLQFTKNKLILIKNTKNERKSHVYSKLHIMAKLASLEVVFMQNGIDTTLKYFQIYLGR